MKSNIYEHGVYYNINNTRIKIKFNTYCEIIVTTIYYNDIMQNQFVLYPKNFFNYNEFINELIYIIYDNIRKDFELIKLEKDDFINCDKNHIVKTLYSHIRSLLYPGDELSNIDTHINLLLDFINLKEQCDGQEN